MLSTSTRSNQVALVALGLEMIGLKSQAYYSISLKKKMNEREAYEEG